MTTLRAALERLDVIISDLARAYDIVKPEPGMNGPHGGYIGGISRERAALAIQNALDYFAPPAADGLPVAALHELFDLLERLDRQADDPGPRHMIEVTAEMWKDQIRPRIQIVQRALDAPAATRTWLDEEHPAGTHTLHTQHGRQRMSDRLVEVENQTKARILAALPAALAEVLSDVDPIYLGRTTLEQASRERAAALVAAIEKVLDR